MYFCHIQLISITWYAINAKLRFQPMIGLAYQITALIQISHCRFIVLITRFLQNIIKCGFRNRNFSGFAISACRPLNSLYFLILAANIVEATPRKNRLRLCTPSAGIFSFILQNSSLQYTKYCFVVISQSKEKSTAHLTHNLCAVLP